MTRRIGGDGREDVDRCRTYRPEGDEDLGIAVERDPLFGDVFVWCIPFVGTLLMVLGAVALYRNIQHNLQAYGLLGAVFVVAAVWRWTHDKARNGGRR